MASSISDRGFDLIVRFEGFRPDWYQCSAHVWTIGYGHAEARREAEAALYRKQIDEALEIDPESIDPAPIQPVPVSISQSRTRAIPASRSTRGSNPSSSAAF